MNIKVNEEQGRYLLGRELDTSVIGSHLYGTNTPTSDKDYLVMYEPLESGIEGWLPIQHQFQWDDKDRNIQWIFTTEAQFYRNLFYGDSTINADILLLDEEEHWHTRLMLCRTYNIIKAYLGFAKRDIKDFRRGRGKNKLFHIQRGLYCVDMLLREDIPTIYDIRSIRVGSLTIDELEDREKEHRKKCNAMFDTGELTLYPKEYAKGYPFDVDPIDGQLTRLYGNASNIKEFRYE